MKVHLFASAPRPIPPPPLSFHSFFFLDIAPSGRTFDPGRMADPELANAPWYHGLLPREDIKAMLKENGDYLVRMSEPAEPGKREFVLSVMFEKDKESVKHYVIKHVGKKFAVEKKQFDSVNELVKHHADTKTSITVVRTTNAGNTVVGRGTNPRMKLHYDSLDYDEVDVAIKLAKLDNMTKEQIKDIMREARLMRFFEHPNIVKLHGVAAFGEPLMIVMELASNGALDSYLEKNKCNLQKKMEMCLQGCWGIEYLHEKNCLHRDLAARNCLYGNGQVKISDFGLSRSGSVYQMDLKKRVPIRWLAPETLRSGIYTQKTDVWSFGIMCWEIFHDGSEPYPGMSVAEMHVKVKGGYRMPLDDKGLAPETIKLIETRLWAESSNDRYSMPDVSKTLERITKTERPCFPTTNSREPSKAKSRSTNKAKTQAE